MAKNKRPCDPAAGQVQKSFREQIEEERLIKSMQLKVKKACDFLKRAMAKKNYPLFDFIMFYWVKPKTLLKYIKMKEYEAAEILRMKLIAEGGAGDDRFQHVGNQLPGRCTRPVPF